MAGTLTRSGWNTASATNNYATVTLGSYASAATLWAGWVSDVTHATGNSAAADTTWDRWATTTTITAQSLLAQPLPDFGAWNRARGADITRHGPLTREQFIRALISQGTAPWREDHRSRRARLAKERASMLLLQHLTEEQRREYTERGRFLVEVKSGRRYEIRRGRQHNVKLVDETRRVHADLCITTSEPVPDEDVMLAQKLLLLLDEEQFLRIANVTAERGSKEGIRLAQDALLLRARRAA